MSTKTTFKRIALVAVAALGLGVLSVAPFINNSTITQDVSIVVPTTAASSTTVAPASSTAYLNAGGYSTASDSAVAVVATAADTTHATIRVVTKNASGSSAPESITATLTGPGLICHSTTCGKSLVVAGTGSTDFTVRADGTAGTSNIVVKTTTVTFPAKTVTFFAKAAKTITTSVNKPAIGIGTTIRCSACNHH
jgi:trimeric autotransporter adhesin